MKDKSDMPYPFVGSIRIYLGNDEEGELCIYDGGIPYTLDTLELVKGIRNIVNPAWDKYREEIGWTRKGPKEESQ